MLVYLRRLDAKIDRIGDDVCELKMRMTTTEQQVASLAATQASHYASLSTRFDRLEGRVERIERRLDLVEIRA
jgi:predicted  nucleic acid-binding Zn-ribbon protein